MKLGLINSWEIGVALSITSKREKGNVLCYGSLETWRPPQSTHIPGDLSAAGTFTEYSLARPETYSPSSSALIPTSITRSSHRRLLNDVKSEPSANDDEIKSISINGDLKLDCHFCGISYESISELQTHTIREHVPMIWYTTARGTSIILPDQQQPIPVSMTGFNVDSDFPDQTAD
ncbi:hypothetical protein KIN20_022939, partial [Parelaphostrongylus tenuis]